MSSIAIDGMGLPCANPRSARISSWFGLGLAAVVFIVLTSWGGVARAQECTDEGTVKSAQLGTATVNLSFRNASPERRRIYWLDADGQRKFYGVVEPEHMLQQPSFPGFAWLVTNDAEKCLSIYTATDASATVDIGGNATAQVIAPPPGAAVAIAPPQAAAAAPQAAAAVPLPFLPTGDQPAAADQTAAGDAVADQAPPVVSPVEQFQLSGNYRLIPPDDPKKALNNEFERQERDHARQAALGQRQMDVRGSARHALCAHQERMEAHLPHRP